MTSKVQNWSRKFGVPENVSKITKKKIKKSTISSGKFKTPEENFQSEIPRSLAERTGFDFYFMPRVFSNFTRKFDLAKKSPNIVNFFQISSQNSEKSRTS